MNRLPAWRARVAALGAAALAACAGNPPERFYVLAPQGTADHAPPAGPARDVVLIVTSIPDSVDRPQLVRAIGPNEVEVLDLERWGEPVRSGIANALIHDLQRRLPGSRIAPAGSADDHDAPVVAVDIAAMQGSRAGAVHLEARWRVRGAGGATASGALAADRQVDGSQPRQIVAAWSSELDEVAQGIARSIGTLP
jgi:uncharacterized lipoprotein YmbA